MRKPLLTLALIFLAPTTSIAGPITTNTALPVHDGELIIRGQGKFLRATDDPSPLDRELSVWAVPTVLVYGATEKLAVFGVLPYLDKELQVTTPEGRRSRGDSGLGDLQFFTRYTALQWDKPGETLRLAPFLGLEVPTGRDDKSDSLGRLPQTLQLGSGSWDPFLGLVFTWQTLDWEFDSSVSYDFKTEANDFELGDLFRLDLSYQYRLWPRELGEGVPGFLYLVAESNLLWQDRNELSGSTDPNSGGTTWFLTPGIQYITKRVILESAVQLPAVQSLGGDALETDFIVTAGFRVNI